MRRLKQWKPWEVAVVVALSCVLPSSSQVSVLTEHNDIARTGQNLNETVLTPNNVNVSTFGKLFTFSVDGYVYAQPLYVPNLTVHSISHNVLFIATEHDSVYAFDADSNGGTNASPLWHITLLDSAHGAASGATTEPSADVGTTDLVPEIGITGTPVIDPSTNTIYLIGVTVESGNAVQRLHALDITSGAEKFGGPVVIQASVPGTGVGSVGGVLKFDPTWANNRPGLLLLNGIVCAAFAAHGDNGPWHGWVLAYKANTLAQTGVFCSTPNGIGSGIWMSGTGLAADVTDPTNHPYGRMFTSTGNGSYNATIPYTSSMNYGDDILHLDLTNGAPTVADAFTPFNQASLSNSDVDLASGGVLLLPDQTSGGFAHLLVQVGKEGTIYLVNRDSMGGFNSSGDNIVEELQNQVQGLWSAPAYWNNNIYFWGNGDYLKAFSLVGGRLSGTPTSVSSETSGYPGATPAVSASGTSNGIIWTIATDQYYNDGPAVLQAHLATNVATTLYTSAQNPTRDTAGTAVKFAVPTISNGKVYIGTQGQVNVYGLLAGTVQTATPTFNPGSESFNGTVSVTITDATPTATIYYTTDGTTPTSSSAIYTGAISIDSTTTINAIATATGLLQSPVATATYTSQTQVATPSFSPPAGTYSSSQSVTISDSTPGSTIYYTTNGVNPTTSSSVYSQPLAVSSTETIKAMATQSASTQSSIAAALYTIQQGSSNAIDFSNGFSGAAGLMTFNGSTDLDDTRLQLTNGGVSEASSAFYNTSVNIQKFTTNFTFQLSNPAADGFTFTIQNAGLTALGQGGGSLGYAGIAQSVCVKFDLYNNNGEGSNSTGLYQNGAVPTTPAIDMTSSGVNLHSGDTMAVSMTYDGVTLAVVVTDAVTNASFTTSWTVNIPSIVGGNTAYVGFTAGTGSLSSSQKIETWTLASSTSPTGPQQVNLTSVFNVSGIYTDNTTFTTGGIDGDGFAYSSNLFGPSLTWNGVPFTLGPANSANVVSSASIPISSAGSYSSLQMLAIGINGNQTSQVFSVTYTDGTSSTFSINLSNWSAPQGFSGETVAETLAYRDIWWGAKDARTFYLFGYSLPLNNQKTISGILLPNNRNVVVVAITLVP